SDRRGVRPVARKGVAARTASPRRVPRGPPPLARRDPEERPRPSGVGASLVQAQSTAGGIDLTTFPCGRAPARASRRSTPMTEPEDRSPREPAELRVGAGDPTRWRKPLPSAAKARPEARAVAPPQACERGNTRSPDEEVRFPTPAPWRPRGWSRRA